MLPYRQLWWLAVLLFTNAASADDSHCPCVLLEECSQTADSYTSCEDPTTVRCCDATSPPPSHNDPLQMVSAHLEQEEKFMEAINNLMEKMQHIATPEGENREDKSLGGTSKNTLNCDGKQCEQKLERSTKEEPIHQPSVDNIKPTSEKLEDLSESQSLESAESNSPGEQPNEGDAKNKLIIVYAENPNKNNTYEEKTPHIIYPSKEAMEEYLQSEETSIMTQQIAAEENRHGSETEDEQDSEALRNQQSANGRPNLHKLFPKRNPPLKSSHSQTKPDDLGEEGSEIEEVKTSVPTTVQTEQSQNRKPFRSLTKHLSPRPVMSDESTQTTSTFEPQRGSRGKVGLSTSMHIDRAKNTQHQDATDAIMEEINLKALNDMMKTNFTGRLSLLRKQSQRPMWHPQSRLHSTSGTNTSSPSGRTHQELRNLPQSTNPQTDGTSTLSEQAASKTPENSESVEHVTNTTATEVKGSRYVTRRRNQFRNQNVNLPSKFSTAVSMSQEQVFDTLKESKPQDASRRRPTYRRAQVKTQTGTPNADLADQINSQSDPSFGKRRSRFRPRSKAENTTPARQNSNSELTSSRTSQNPGSIVDNPTPTVLNQNAGHAAATHSEVPQTSDVKLEDLESSGSDVDPRRVRVRGRFSPPQRMEKGFQPMFGPAELNVIGPVPAGFQDRAREFSNEEFGFELPRANLHSQFTEEEQFQFDAEEETENPLRLLPPVFPVSQPPTSRGVSSGPSSMAPDTFSDADLLPPLETPKPLSVSLEKVMPKAAEKLMLDQHRDITELNQEFNQLKTRYDMLLNRYAETLKVYNDKYRNLFGSNENKK